MHRFRYWRNSFKRPSTSARERFQWDLFHSIPSIETPGVSVLDEYYWLNKKDPNYSLCRATKNRGEDAHTDGKFNLSQKGCMEIMKLFMTRDEDLYDKTIEDVFDAEDLAKKEQEKD